MTFLCVIVDLVYIYFASSTAFMWMFFSVSVWGSDIYGQSSSPLSLIFLTKRNVVCICHFGISFVYLQTIMTTQELIEDVRLQLKPLEVSTFDVRTAEIAVDEMGMGRSVVTSILLLDAVRTGARSVDEIQNEYGEDVGHILSGLKKINDLYSKNPVINTDNFRDLLLSFAEDMRVVFIIIAERVNRMRGLKDSGTEEERQKISTEASFLYAPLAHKLGLYLIKSELEDLSMKYLEHDAYYMIKDKLNETKRSRDAYIEEFITPMQQKLEAAGLKFHIKGRTKSIHSIWQKMKKQKCQFEGIYDLFAIRIILDSVPEKEKQDCWQVYSIVTDMYHPNPKRLRDWLSVPKSNGYESLHTTVMGPEGKWVEVQIRTERMDDIAEHGYAAHWRYKGVKDSGTKLENWLNDLRASLESNDSSDEGLIDQFKVDLYSDEVFVFTPKGDLFKLPKGATVLDFAFSIHTNVGSHCTGGLVNGKNVPMKTKLENGDQVEIKTSQNQQPKQDWLAFVITSKARNKIRQSLHEQELRTATYAKEEIERRMKNRKIEYDETILNKVMRRLGFKQAMEFYKAIRDEVLDVNKVITAYLEIISPSSENPDQVTESAENFRLEQTQGGGTDKYGDTLIIDKNVKGLDYQFAKCCNPIYGDKIVGFVTLSRGITIHRADCQNARHMLENVPYRRIDVKWSESGGQSQVILHVLGNDDIGIVNNLTSIILKEKGTVLRSIDIHSSEDGLFSGHLVLMISDISRLNSLIKKLKDVKGVKQVSR